MKYTQKYIQSFGNNLTNEQLYIIKNSFGYKKCELVDSFNKVKLEVLKQFKKVFKWERKNETIQ